MGYLGSSTDFYKVGWPPLCFPLCTAFLKPAQISHSGLSSPLLNFPVAVSSFPFIRTTTMFHVGTIYPLPIVLLYSVLLNADDSPKLPFHLHFLAYSDSIGSWINVPGEVQLVSL